ncbi:sugar phosphate isomerase/epimerase family protein [Halalkalibacterium ligniniphilum]|uniref:sugar phosphate isomerase/epimerase family protein n=1 Tax=Halalkalibacterium ligniniphilum TaxID=1134413 RepID=UPI00034C8FC4|nr:sugar phosphate isomerase/epimerase family protein [Halalkalibacterium ligniniphilum]
MRQQLHDFMQVGIVHFMAYPHAESSKDYIRTLSSIIEDDFFGAIEIKTAPNEQTANEARGLLESAGVTVGYSAHPILIRNQANLHSLKEEERQRALELMKGAIDEAYQMGAKNLALMSGKDPGAKYRGQALEYFIEALKEMCTYAKSKGDLEILLEPFDHETDFKCLIGPSELAVEIAQEVRKVDPSFGVMVDLSHLPMLGETPVQALTTTKDYLKHAHIGNCLIQDPNHPLYGDKHPRFGYKGSEIGIPELSDFLRALLEIGYLEEGKSRVVAFEIKPAPGESSEAIIAQAKRTLRTAWQRV